MHRLQLPLLACALLGAAAFVTPPDPVRHPSLVSEVLATYHPRPDARSAQARVAAARALVEVLGEEGREQLRHELTSGERRAWTNLPPRAEEPGLRLGDLERDALEKVFDFLATCLSERGYARTRDILLADDRLLRGGQPRVGFGAENFWLLWFGEPSEDQPWGLQLDGHHLGLNLGFEGEEIFLSPTFWGAQPAVFERDEGQVEPLHGPVHAALALMQSLSDDQRQAALISKKRRQLVAGPGEDGVVPELVGLPCGDLSEEQRGLLRTLLQAYVADLPKAVATGRLEEIWKELSEMHFAWSGPWDEAADLSYRLQSPSFLVELACQGMGGQPRQHLHAMFRSFHAEYGGQLPR